MKPYDKYWNIPPNVELALYFAKRHIAEFVCDAVNLEGINITLPEVQTLLDGITVGGHKINDQQIILNQANAWRFLFEIITNNTFEVSSELSCIIHKIAAKEESLKWGEFRTGSVTISGTDYIPPKACLLSDLFNDMITQYKKFDDIYNQAIYVFLIMARYQFFYDVNKRMGRFMMNGLLLNEGYPAINVPAKRQLEFNQLMIDFYNTNNQKPMNNFMRSCLDDRIIKIMKENT